MNNNFQRPNVPQILQGLKDFQRNTVEYVFRRIYLDKEPARRFLIADEVGLGKTLVARGLIAKTIDYLWDRNEPLNIIYMCSNAEIAQQNIKRLNIIGQTFEYASRPTLLPYYTHELGSNRLNFIAFTPKTAFEMQSGLGIVWERVLLYWWLDCAWKLHNIPGAITLLRGQTGEQSFRDKLRSNYVVDQSIASAFIQEMQQDDELYHRFTTMCRKIQQFGSIQPQDKKECNQIIGELREILARICLAQLRPTLIILDEFQRFKHILQTKDIDDETDEELSLSEQFFRYADEHPDARVILLSATPYKMYTQVHEDEDHYQDFLQTIHFLCNGQSQSFKECINEYRSALFRLGSNESIDHLISVKQQLEHHLKQVMVRTERLSSTADRNGMLIEVPNQKVTLKSPDVKAYCALHQIAHNLEHQDILEYWKSSPYLLNFMGRDEYQLKRAFVQSCSSAAEQSDLIKIITETKNLLINWQEIESYTRIDPGNAKLRQLLSDTTNVKTWQLLWIPPSLPYYQLAGPFADKTLSQITKRLIFSSWRVVPKTIAILMSYEVERQMVRSFEYNSQNTPRVRKRRGNRLQFELDVHKKPTSGSMAVLGLMYPCVKLAMDYDPLSIAIKDTKQTNKDSKRRIKTILTHIEKKIASLLNQILPQKFAKETEDENWYWAAPILLDKHFYPQRTLDWFRLPNLAEIWSSSHVSEDGEEEVSISWSTHVQHACDLVQGHYKPRGRPPADLAYVLAKMTVAAPGIVALRSLWRATDFSNKHMSKDSKIENLDICLYASWVAWCFRSLFNKPEATAMVQGQSTQNKNPYWHNVLDYCVHGCLQSVLDEYVHVLRESLVLSDQSPEEVSYAVGDAIYQAMSLRTVSLGFDEITVDQEKKKIDLKSRRMRSHFAMRFSDEETSGDQIGQQPTRASQVRQAFNSPFWPFVLCTTSVGQEGLDFHTYCHAVVHWNLPSNPVDLEQREGRVHRYKGHAVRKNLAQRYGMRALAAQPGSQKVEKDPWETLFNAAVSDPERPAGAQDIFPYWICEGDAKIERHVPALPLSKEQERLIMLRHALTLYHMVFGQAHQDDVITFLQTHLKAEQIEALVEQLRINLEPPPSSPDATCKK